MLFTKFNQSSVILFSLVLGLMVVFSPIVEAEEVSGFIYSGVNDHWGTEGNVKSPVVINSEVTVGPDTKLIIDPGTIVIFTTPVGINVEKGGKLIAKGIKDNWITFTTLDLEALSRPAIFAKEGNLTFEYCYFGNLAGISLLKSSKMVMERCILDKMYGMDITRQCKIYVDHSYAEIISNLFCGTKGGSQYIEVNDGYIGTFDLSPEECLELIECGNLKKRSDFSIIEKNIFKENEGLGGGIIHTDGTTTIKQNIIKNNKCSMGIYVSLNDSLAIMGTLDGKFFIVYLNTEIIDNLISDNKEGISTGNVCPLIEGNAIYNNSEYNLSCNRKLDVRNNYWGGERPDVKKFKGGPVNFSPWLKEFPAKVLTEEETGVPTWDGLITTWTRMLEDKDERVRNYVAAHLYGKGIDYGVAGEFKKAQQTFTKILDVELFCESTKTCLEIVEDVLKQRIKTEAARHIFKGMACDNNEAIAEYKEAIEINPEYIRTHKYLGSIYFNKGMYDETIAEYKKVVTINPNDAKAHNNLAVAYYYKEEYSLAVKHCDKAIELEYKVHPGFLKTLEPYRNKVDKLEGFRGVKWGDPPGEDMVKEMALGNVSWYKRKNDKLQIGAARLQSIDYLFYKDQFMQVNIMVKKGYYKSLENVVNLKFGRGKWQKLELLGYEYEWFGDTTTVELLNTSLNPGVLIIRSTKIYNQKEADEYRKKQEAAEEGSDDF